MKSLPEQFTGASRSLVTSAACVTGKQLLELQEVTDRWSLTQLSNESNSTVTGDD